MGFVHRPEEFIECEDPVDHAGNTTAQRELGYGCVKVGWKKDGFVTFQRVFTTGVVLDIHGPFTCVGLLLRSRGWLVIIAHQECYVVYQHKGIEYFPQEPLQ